MFTVFAITKSGVGLSNTYSTIEQARREARFSIEAGYRAVEILNEETKSVEAVIA